MITHLKTCFGDHEYFIANLSIKNQVEVYFKGDWRLNSKDLLRSKQDLINLNSEATGVREC